MRERQMSRAIAVDEHGQPSIYRTQTPLRPERAAHEGWSARVWSWRSGHCSGENAATVEFRCDSITVDRRCYGQGCEMHRFFGIATLSLRMTKGKGHRLRMQQHYERQRSQPLHLN